MITHLKRHALFLQNVPDWLIDHIDFVATLALGIFAGVIAAGQDASLIGQAQRLGTFPLYFWIAILIIVRLIGRAKDWSMED